jgi:hypothetical protein
VTMEAVLLWECAVRSRDGRSAVMDVTGDDRI